MNRNKKAWFIILSFIMLLSFTACSFGVKEQTDMIFNGNVQFHGMKIIIPDDFVKDSNESTDELWVFEKGNYDEYILLSYKTPEDPSSAMHAYADSISEKGANIQDGWFIDDEAIMASYTSNDDKETYEIMFAHGDGLFSIAYRGGTQDDIYAITDTVKFGED